MINQLNNPYNYTAAESACIAASGNNWNSGSNCMNDLKYNMNSHYDRHQREKCCYCGLLYDRTGRGEIDHIAPKAAGTYPQFTFTPNNLAKACQLCNSSSMKHTYNSISALAPIYENCTFSIVHPYLDDPNLHFSWSYGFLHIVISVNNNSAKGRESIRLFELDSEKRTKARAAQRILERLEAMNNVTIEIKRRIRAVLTF